MSSIIKLRTDKDWGTAFCIGAPNDLRFLTADHVLQGCGITDDLSEATVEMCDQRLNSISGTQRPYTIKIKRRDKLCDVAEFLCDFPGVPFSCDTSLGRPGLEVLARGYLDRPFEPREPDCGEVIDIQGTVQSREKDSTETCDRLVVDNKPFASPHLHGMSGSPILANENIVVALLIGASRPQGIPPFLGAIFPPT